MSEKSKTAKQELEQLLTNWVNKHTYDNAVCIADFRLGEALAEDIINLLDNQKTKQFHSKLDKLLD